MRTEGTGASAPVETPSEDAIQAAVAEAGTYELLKKRLTAQGAALGLKAQRLNEARVAEFGRSEIQLAARLRARTENNCVARDIVRIGNTLLFGYNVFIGLRKETRVEDVFALYRLESGADELEPQPIAGGFLADQRFVADFRELYAYYKQASLNQLRVTQDRLLAAFQIGQKLQDIRVFRWAMRSDGTLQYIDNRGEREMALPPTHDFEWTPTTRDDHVTGKHPHVNILDTVFVETLGGDLTVKVENNTESGLGIYREPVDDSTQSLVDAEIAYARLGALILLRIRPYREETVRHLVFNSRTEQVTRIDAIGVSCLQLPEDHGILFAGGYYLQSGESKRFDIEAAALDGMRFKRLVRSPNGEDVLYVFYQPGPGRYGLFSYNLIEKTLGTPILSNGYARFDDGRLLVFQSDGQEPTRTHQMQLWHTPFVSDDHAGRNGSSQTFFGRIGNADLVRGISELLSIARSVREQSATRAAYEDLIRQASRVLDTYFWLDQPESEAAAQDVRSIVETARAARDEFDKVAAIRRETAEALAQAAAEQRALLTEVASRLWREPQEFVHALDQMRIARGRLLELRDRRYADATRLAALDAELAQEQQRVGERASQFLAADKAFDSYRTLLAGAAGAIDQAQTTTQVAKALEMLDGTARGLDLLGDLLGSLPDGDATSRTAILDRVSLVYSEVNRLRARGRHRDEALGSTEAAAEFGAQIKLFGQALENALDSAGTPERADDALTRLLAQLEDLEGRFGEREAFVADLLAKRESVYEAFSARKHALLEARQRRVQALQDAASRILQGVPRRVASLPDIASAHAYFASDPLLGKLRSLVADLRALDASVVADDLETQLKTAGDRALRAMRDNQDLVADDGQSIRFGRHSFTVNRQPLDLTLLPKNGGLAFHLTSTDYAEAVCDERLDALREHWQLTIISESAHVCRAEYLAGQVIAAARNGRGTPTWSHLLELAVGFGADPAPLQALVREHAAPRYQEGYQKGVHDDDSARLLAALVPMEDGAGLLRHGPRARALALLYWTSQPDHAQRENLRRQSRNSRQMRELFNAGSATQGLVGQLAEQLGIFGAGLGFLVTPEEGEALIRDAAEYLVAQLAGAGDDWVVHGAAQDLHHAMVRYLEGSGRLHELRQEFSASALPERWSLARQWTTAYAAAHEPQHLAWVDDAATLFAVDLPRARANVVLDTTVSSMLGEHSRIVNQSLAINLNDFHARFQRHEREIVPAFRELQSRRLHLVGRERARLGLEQYQARPLSSFVRNRLIDEVYLPIIGDNLSKQIGTAGAGNRGDRMGLLLLISPPGYGKTTLLEYVADRLGLIFVRINGPALGSDVVSFDPTQARHSAARQELEKLNLALAMGNNVMLYVDDIQHTNPEFLQKFISLCDATRRAEGVWNGEPRTYDLRGKRFAVAMAGNPYTESGAVFRIPDMLANRADIYNLGDVLSGREALFALSYIENSLTANPTLRPLASRDPGDVHLLVRMAEGDADVPTSGFSHGYSPTEIAELTGILQRLFRVRDVLLKVNLAYIESAAQQDEYRDEPAFKLQGSYRNMAKLAAKISAVMQPQELDALLRDHYRGEAQTLASGTEENLLKLAEILGTQTTEEKVRWQSIKDDFLRNKKMGGPDADGSTRLATQLADIAVSLSRLQASVGATDRASTKALTEGFAALADKLAALGAAAGETPAMPPSIGESVQRMGEVYEKSLVPLISATYRKMRLDHSIWEHVTQMADEIKRLDLMLAKTPGTKAAGKDPGNTK